MARILFLYRWHSVPGGFNSTYLKEHDREANHLSLDDDDFAAALATAQAACV